MGAGVSNFACTSCGKVLSDYRAEVGYDGPFSDLGECASNPFAGWLVLCKPCSRDPKKNPLLQPVSGTDAE